MAPGTYIENVRYYGKDVLVTSEAGPAVTVIDGSQPAHPDTGSVVIIAWGEGPGAVLEGFTVTGGAGTILDTSPFPHLGGGGVYVRGGATIRGNWILENEILGTNDNIGGGIYATGDALITDNRIYSNTVHTHFSGFGIGAGVALGWTGKPTLEDNVIFDNHAIPTEELRSLAGGVLVFRGLQQAAAVVRQNLIVCNTATRGAGMVVDGTPSGPLVEQNTIALNLSTDLQQPEVAGVLFRMYTGDRVGFSNNNLTDNIGGGVECEHSGSAPHEYVFECNNVFGNPPDPVMGDCPDFLSGATNLSVPAMYGEAGCTPGGDAFCLTPGSPLLPENSPPGCGLIGARDLCGTTGVANGGGSPGGVTSFGPGRPNPLAGDTELPIVLARPSVVEVAIYDSMGRLVRRVFHGQLPAGEHGLQWDGTDDRGRELPSGAYIARVEVSGRRFTQKLLILR